MISIKPTLLLFFCAVMVHCFVGCSNLPGEGVSIGCFPQSCDALYLQNQSKENVLCLRGSIGGIPLEHNAKMEDIAIEFVHKKFPTYNGGSALFRIDYTYEQCTGIKLYSFLNATMIDDITDLFYISQEESCICWFDKGESLMEVPPRGFALSDFIDNRPLMPVTFILTAPSISYNSFKGNIIAIELELDHVKQLSCVLSLDEDF
ncbi:MAG: hypothetical protein J5533_04865 [Bacteroidales bacterium]|nr:hypothetical protein [Bacteroidales bacterium]